jgi:AbrB family looped-hinge helix DNA binding protein
MAKVKQNETCCTTEAMEGCCKVEAVVSIDERGQMVLPKEARDKAGIRAGDKLAVISWGKGEEVSCLTLMKAEAFGGMVKGMLGPLMTEIFQKQEIRK